MHKVEKELIKATHYKTRQKYSDRQDYLKSLFLATVKLTNPEFDELTDEAADWVNACVQIHNTKRNEDFPDFDEVKPKEEPDEETDEEAEDETSEDEDDAEDEQGDDDASPEKEDDESADEQAPEDEDETVDEDDEPEPETVKKTKKPQTKRIQHTEDAVLDKWGCIETSKNSQALAMFEAGATAREVKQRLGGTYYNILTKMVQKGHRIEKDGSLIKLIHKDESKATKKPKK